MASHTRIENVTRGYFMKHSQALKGIDNCALAWVEVGVSVRALNLAESLKMREIKASEPPKEPLRLDYYEVSGIKFDKMAPEQRHLVAEAHKFFDVATQ